MQMQCGRLRKFVVKDNSNSISLVDFKGGSGHVPVVAIRVHPQARQNFPAYRFGNQMKLFCAVNFLLLELLQVWRMGRNWWQVCVAKSWHQLASVCWATYGATYAWFRAGIFVHRVVCRRWLMHRVLGLR